MKKYLIIAMLVTFMMVLLCACGNSDSKNQKVTEEATTGEAALEEIDVKKETAEDNLQKKSESSEGKIATEEATAVEETAEEKITGEENKEVNMETLTAKELVSNMRIGWNLGNTLDAYDESAMSKKNPFYSETCWGNPKTSKELMDAVVEKGFNVIRIPTTWHGHLSDDGSYTIDQAWMDRVQEVVDYAYDDGVYVILNVHHDTDTFYSVYADQKDESIKALTAVWKQIAERFQDYDEHLIFEGMNEPRKIGTDVEWNGGDQEGWETVNELNAAFVSTIRNADGNNTYRILMIPGYGANCWEGMKHIKVPENDQKIIVSVHAYEPYNFALNKDGVDVWNHDTNNIDMIMNNIRTQFLIKGIPVVIGEFGAMNKPNPANEEERAAWAEYYVCAARKIGVPCIWWDNGLFEGDGELFGLIDRNKLEWKYPKVVDALLK